MDFSTYKTEIEKDGFTIIPNVFSENDVNTIVSYINEVNTSSETFRKSANLFAIRQFLKEVPKVKRELFNNNLKSIVSSIFGEDYFVVKSIYFDKPEESNWFVSYHQDLTISVNTKSDIEGYSSWTVKQGQFAVQPPINVLENIYTIRIHLDNTTEENGVLKVVPQSHNKEIYRPETIDWNTETETICNVDKGGIMIMKPLLLHSSSRTTNNKRRRVIHIEFSNKELPQEIHWAEKLSIN
ncbi:phytanoyl-CoA dioxygenase [Flavobacterium arcticum]|uniref:Phytanoyl-CoA dioxygenase n=1 Tax=Flavobacterium arcticum TaxID=1784713 RepID=A0A345HD81_9FLAO|nr:phytanoyl-CoA dioxygenase family protein [Flavobacterium arcticum]AXG74541.1 phytanoyl-CoA dioxygenase [Flavobacterium arcticum]KAF2512339.1 phytanoyl-CoA dioxygenase family protein [Flavobacterium arcticum]